MTASSPLDLVETNYRVRVRAARETALEEVQRAYEPIVAAEVGDRRTERITPTMAAAWLADRAVRSPFDPAKAASIAAAMIAGTFQDDPANPVQVTPKGQLLNGVHRLTGVVDSGVTIEATVAFDVRPGAIETTFAEFLQPAAAAVTSGQAQAEALAVAYANLGARIAGRKVEDPGDSRAGITRKGLPILLGLAGIRPMILRAIAEGRPLEDALAYGRHLSVRFTDAEITRVLDETVQHVARHATGWRGIVYSPQDDCRGNAGTHPFSEPMYRHGSCRCERVVVWS